MHQSSSLLESNDLCSLLLISLIVAGAGHVLLGNRPRLRAFGSRAGAVAFFLSAGYCFLNTSQPAEAIFEIAFGAAGLAVSVMGAVWLALGLVTHVWEWAVRPPLRAVRRSLGNLHYSRAERSRQRKEQQEQQEQQLREEHERPGREQAAREAEVLARTEQQRRDDARAACELLYCSREEALRERFPKAAFDAFVQKYLGDGLPAETVEQRAGTLRQTIDRLSGDEPGRKQVSLRSVCEWYTRQKEDIDTIDLDEELRDHLRAELEERADEILRTLLREMQP